MRRRGPIVLKTVTESLRASAAQAPNIREDRKAQWRTGRRSGEQEDIVGATEDRRSQGDTLGNACVAQERTLAMSTSPQMKLSSFESSPIWE